MTIRNLIEKLYEYDINKKVSVKVVGKYDNYTDLYMSGNIKEIKEDEFGNIQIIGEDV